MAPSSGWVGCCQASFPLYPTFMSGGGWSMRMWNQMLLIWTLSKANGVEKKAVQLTASTAYTSCLISSHRKKTRRGQYQTFCSAFHSAPSQFFFFKSDLIEATHPMFFLLKWKLQRIKKCADMQRQIQFQSMPRLFRLSSTHSWLPHCLFYPSLFHSFRSVTQNSLLWDSGGVTHLDLMSAE